MNLMIVTFQQIHLGDRLVTYSSSYRNTLLYVKIYLSDIYKVCLFIKNYRQISFTPETRT